MIGRKGDAMAALLVRTKAALEAYDADEARRDKLLDDVKTDADVAAWEREEEAALEKVRRAFHEDTADRNSWSQAKVVDLATLREWVEKEIEA
jgi:hypothetical protein